MVSTESSDRPEHSTIRPDQAITTIRQFCLDHREVVSHLVSSVDDRVGMAPTNERFEERVAAAAFAKMPWEFMFILGGGERRVSESIEGLSDTDDGPLLLGLVAVTEILSLDAGVGVDRLVELASEMGRQRVWVEEVLSVLVGRRLASIRAGRVRTPHIRLAQQALWALCRDTSGSHWDRLADLIARRFADMNESLEGRQWLSSMLSNSDSNRARRNRLFPDNVARSLVEEISTVSTGRERSVAGEMIWEINSWWAMTDELAEQVEHLLVRWLPEITSEDVHGIFRAFNALQEHRPSAGRVTGSVAPEQIAAIVTKEVDLRRGHDWGWLLSGLAHAEGVDSEKWSERFARALDVEQLVDRVTIGIADKVAGAVDFIHSLSQFAPRAATECIRAITPAVIGVIESDLAFTAHALVGWCFIEFNVAAMIRNRSGDLASREEIDELIASAPEWIPMANALADLVEAADWVSAGRSIAAADCHLEDLDSLGLLGHAISRLAPDRWSEAMAAVDLDHLDKISQGEWAPSTRVARLAYTLSRGSDPSPARRWVQRHAGELEQVTPFLAVAAPELALEASRRGIPVILTDMNGGDVVARALDEMAAIDSEATKAVLLGNEERVRTALGREHSSSWEGIERLVRAIDRVDPEWLDGRLSEIDAIETHRARWSAYERNDGPTARATQFLLKRTAKPG
jgi:hypothetical protein